MFMINKNKFLRLMAVLACVLCFAVPGEAATPKWSDVPYATVSAKQKLDIYLPEKGVAPYPVIIAFHGRNGDKKGAEMEAPLTALERGYVVICVNYREVPEARFPNDVMDAKAAVRFVRANSDKYNLDDTRFVAWGDSMGGRLAAFLGTTTAHPEFDDFTLGHVGESSRVNAVVAWFPALDDVNMDADFAKLNMMSQVPRNKDAYGRETYGAPVQQIRDLVAFSNPMRYVDASAVPFIIEHGTADGVCPITQSEKFAELLRHNIGDGRVKFVTVEGAGHHVKDFMGKENMEQVFKFLHKQLQLKKKAKQDKTYRK